MTLNPDIDEAGQLDGATGLSACPACIAAPSAERLARGASLAREQLAHLRRYFAMLFGKTHPEETMP